MSPLRYQPSLGYKWLDRYKQCGPDRLQDHSRSPRWRRNQPPAAIEERILALPARQSRWGPTTLKASSILFFDSTARAAIVCPQAILR